MRTAARSPMMMNVLRVKPLRSTEEEEWLATSNTSFPAVPPFDDGGDDDDDEPYDDGGVAYDPAAVLELLELLDPESDAPGEAVAFDELADEVTLLCSASAWNAAKLCGPSRSALMENTIPAAQCPVWRQYIHTGPVSLTWKINSTVVVSFGGTGMKPESKPWVGSVRLPGFFWQGASKVDWVTVWFLG